MMECTLDEGNINKYHTSRPIKFEINDNGCWICTSHSDRGKGYRSITRNYKTISLHRYSYEFHKGKIPKGMVVMHSCDNRSCINPSHLSVGTQQKNMDDMKSKKRQRHKESHAMSKLIQSDVDYIRKSKETGVSLAKKFNVTPANISAIRNFKTWTE